MTFNLKKVFAVSIVALSLAIAGFAMVQTASAAGTCGNCGGGDTGGGDTGGDTGGGSSTPTPVCNISIDKAEVHAIGESYRVTWNGTPSSATFFINGSEVADSGAANFTFTGPNYDRFKMVGNNSGKECVKEVTIIMHVEEPPRCESFTASPTSLPVGGGTVTLKWDTTNATNATIDGQKVAGDGSMTQSVTADKTFTLSLSNAVGSASCKASVKVQTTSTLPTCTITASPASINVGAASTLSWTTKNASSVTIDQGIGNVTGTSKSVTPSVTTTYTMTVKNATGDSAVCKATVTVTATPLPTCYLTASPATITSGGSSTLSWTTNNAASTSIDQGIGVVTGSSKSVTPSVTTTYTMTVKNAAGTSAVCKATVTVNPNTPDAPTCDSFTVSPSTITRGASAVLTWNTTNTTNVSITGAVGTQNSDGSYTVSPTETTNYVLTAYGSNNQTASCNVSLVVNQVNNPLSCEDNVTFYATRSSINEGESSELIWSTTGITSLSISNLSVSALSGSQTVSPSSDITYTLTATNGTNTISCPVAIAVDEDDGGGSSGGSSSPSCDLDISDDEINFGDRVTLSWNTSHTDDITLEDDHGQTILESDDNDDMDGEISLRPERDTVYTLTAERGSKDRTCKVSVDVKDTVTIVESRDQQPLVGGISLTQVPYTGFEAGPILTMIFYGLLLLWALYLAYIIVIRRNSVGGLALAPATPAPVLPSVKTIETPKFVSTEAEVAVMTPVVAATAATPAPVVGYAAVTRDEAYDAVANKVEDSAHAKRVLLSSEAMRHFIDATDEANREDTLTAILEKTKASYPSEDGWVVLNLERMQNVLAAVLASVATPAVEPVITFTPASAIAGNSSLAEAVVTGNIVAAYQMIGHRPMVALAEAATELDALYRSKQGHEVLLSGLLQAEGENLSVEQVKAAIAALTGALDGTYSDEAEAVKMAILKAIKALS